MPNKELAKKLIKKIDIKKAVSFAGTILMLIALIFVFRRLFHMREDLDFSIFSHGWIFVPLLSIVLLESFTLILASINYRSLVVSISGVFVPWHIAIKIYNITNMYKFIPGGLMQMVGRNRLALETEGLGHGKVALATVTEGVLWAIAAFIFSFIFAFNHLIYYLRQLDASLAIILILSSAFLITIFILYRFRKSLKLVIENIKNDTSEPFITIGIKHLIFMIAIVSLWGLSFLATLTVLGQPLTLPLAILVSGLFVLSWLMGYLTPGAPSGLGIREFVLLMSLSGIISEEILLSAIILQRILQIFGDILAYVMTMTYVHAKTIRNQNSR